MLGKLRVPGKDAMHTQPRVSTLWLSDSFNPLISGFALRFEPRHRFVKAEVGVNSVQNESG
jgi:hypothetical protein